MSPPSAFTPHAAARLTKRGATEAEVVATSGPASPAPPSTTAPPSAAISRPRGVTKQNLRHETAGGLYCFRGRRLARHYRPREILLKAAMKLSYDPKANVAYIRLRERQGDGSHFAESRTQGRSRIPGMLLIRNRMPSAEDLVRPGK